MAYILEITGEGTTISREITDVQLAKVLAMLAGTPGEVPAVPPPPPSPPAGGRLSPSEFLGTVNAKTNAEKIAAFILYAKEHRSENSLGRDAVPSYFRNAGQKVPSNISRDLRTAAEEGWIAPELDAHDRFYLTDTGRRHLQRTGPENDGSSSKRASSRRSRSSARSRETHETVDLGLTSDESASFKEFFAGKRPSTQGDQVLTVMCWLLENTSRTRVSRAEIVTALRHARARVPARLRSVLSNLRMDGLIIGRGDELGLSHTGRDRVDHDLPAKTQDGEG